MDPAAVRPDRDFTGRQLPAPVRPRPAAEPARPPAPDREEHWRRLPVEVRTMIMNLLNVETMVGAGAAPGRVQVSRGDTVRDAAEVYPLPVGSIREVIEDPTRLKGKRTEVGAERC